MREAGPGEPREAPDWHAPLWAPLPPCVVSSAEGERQERRLPREQQVPLGRGWGQTGATINGPLLKNETKKSMGELGPRWGRGWWRTYHGGEVCVLLAARGDDALPQLQGDVGDVVGAGDGGAVQGGQVGRLHWRPTSRLQVNHHQLLLGQHHQGVGVVKGWGTGGVSGAAGAVGSRLPQPIPAESEALVPDSENVYFKNKLQVQQRTERITHHNPAGLIMGVQGCLNV